MRVDMGLGFVACFPFLFVFFWREAGSSELPSVRPLFSSSDRNAEGFSPEKRRRRRCQKCLRLSPFPLYHETATKGHRLQSVVVRLVGHVFRTKPLETFAWICTNVCRCIPSPFVHQFWVLGC